MSARSYRKVEMVSNKTNKSQSDKLKKLIVCVKRNETKEIAKILSEDNSLLNLTCGTNYGNNNIFICACSDQYEMQSVNGTTINTLIRFGGDGIITKAQRKSNWKALHYVAINANKEKLQTILKALNSNQRNSLAFCSALRIRRKYPWNNSDECPRDTFSNNALHVLIKFGNRQKQFKDCIELLIESGVSIYQKDSNGVTPQDLLRQLNDKEIDGLLEKFKNDTDLPPYFDIFNYLYTRDFENFQTLELTPAQVDAFDGFDEDNSSCTLLQLICAEGYESCAEFLLRRGASTNFTIQSNPNFPIYLAMKCDVQPIVTMILNQRNNQLPQDILIRLLTKHRRRRAVKLSEKYVEVLINHIRNNPTKANLSLITFKDELDNTPLHYSTYNGYSQSTRSLLSFGAPLTSQNIFGLTPLDYIEPILFEETLDNCVMVPNNDDDDMSSIMNSMKNEKKNFCLELNYGNFIDKSQVGMESIFLRQMVKVKNLKRFLNHPVISSYLQVKWQRFKWFCIINFLLYFVAYVALLFYGFAFSKFTDASKICLIVALILLFIRQLSQLMVFKLTKIEHYLDLPVICGIIYIIAASWFEELLNQNLLVAYSVVFLMSTLGIFLQLDNFPYFTLKVTILRRITYNFCKYIIVYSIPILAFAFCFYMLIEESDETGYHFFHMIYTTIAMFAGDPSADFPDQFESNPAFAHTVYIIFVLLIGIVLQNLLIGLAVSDLQEIQQEAEYVEKRERVQYVTKIEQVMFTLYNRSPQGSIFQSLFRKLLKITCVFQTETVLIIQPYNFGCVFAKDHPDKKMFIDDQNVLKYLQDVFKSMFNKKDDMEEGNTLDGLHKKMENMERMLTLLIKTSNPNSDL